MVTVISKKSNTTRVIMTNVTRIPVAQVSNKGWVISKKYLLNPLTNSDTPYAPDYYYDMTFGDSRVRHQMDNDARKVRAIQTMLHQQTNYDDLLIAGLYDQPLDVVRECLKPWFTMIADRFPKYRNACESEYSRHLRKYHCKRATV